MTQISDIFLQRIARIIRIFRRKRRRWPDAEQSEWQEPPRLKNPYNPCNPLWKNTSEPLARRSQFFMNLIICGFRRIHVKIVLPQRSAPCKTFRPSYQSSCSSPAPHVEVPRIRFLLSATMSADKFCTFKASQPSFEAIFSASTSQVPVEEP